MYIPVCHNDTRSHYQKYYEKCPLSLSRKDCICLTLISEATKYYSNISCNAVSYFAEMVTYNLDDGYRYSCQSLKP